MKKMTALLLALVMCLPLAACGGDVSGEVSESDASVSSAVTADNTNAKITDEQVKALTEAYNQVAPLYNDVYVAAEKNGWLNDEQTVAELNAVGGTMGVIGQALTEDMTMLDGADIDALPDAILQFVPELQKMAEKFAVAYTAG